MNENPHPLPFVLRSGRSSSHAPFINIRPLSPLQLPHFHSYPQCPWPALAFAFSLTHFMKYSRRGFYLFSFQCQPTKSISLREYDRHDIVTRAVLRRDIPIYSVSVVFISCFFPFFPRVFFPVVNLIASGISLAKCTVAVTGGNARRSTTSPERDRLAFNYLCCTFSPNDH